MFCELKTCKIELSREVIRAIWAWLWETWGIPVETRDPGQGSRGRSGMAEEGLSGWGCLGKEQEARGT
jgi:hypothetical protein